MIFLHSFLEGRLGRTQVVEAKGYSRSVMPFDVLGGSRATMLSAMCFCIARGGKSVSF